MSCLGRQPHNQGARQPAISHKHVAFVAGSYTPEGKAYKAPKITKYLNFIQITKF